jgi:hypothetical protein
MAARLAAFRCLLTIVFLVAAVRAWGVSVTASCDRTQLAVGDSAMLTIAVDGTQNAPAPAVGQIAGFQVQYQGPATQISWVNRQMSASISHRYVLVARQAGEFTLGPFEVDVGGSTQRTVPIRIHVTAASQPVPVEVRRRREAGSPG